MANACKVKCFHLISIQKALIPSLEGFCIDRWIVSKQWLVSHQLEDYLSKGSFTSLHVHRKRFNYILILLCCMGMRVCVDQRTAFRCWFSPSSTHAWSACIFTKPLHQHLPPLKITLSFHFYLKMFKFRNIKFLTHKSKTAVSFHFTKYFKGWHWGEF